MRTQSAAPKMSESSGRAIGPAEETIARARRISPAVQDLVQLARFLDNRFVIPGSDVRFGLDSLLGLFPGAGDIVSALISLYIVERAKAEGAPERLLNRMRLNIAIDTLIGALPLLGDIFDVAFKANVKNVRLLLDHLGVDADLGDSGPRIR